MVSAYLVWLEQAFCDFFVNPVDGILWSSFFTLGHVESWSAGCNGVLLLSGHTDADICNLGKSLQEIVSFTRMRYRSSRVSGLRDLRAGVWGLSCQGLRATLRGLRCFRKKGC